MTSIATQRVVVTGGAGFLGPFVVEKLRMRGYQKIFVSRRKDYDLVQLEAGRRLCGDTQPDILIHLAALVGEIPGQVARDTSKPDGQPRRMLDTRIVEARA